MPVIKDDDCLLIRCTCHSHVLEVAWDDWNDTPREFCVTVWNQTPTPFSFRDRLKMIWTLLRGKNLEGGDVIITPSDAVALANFLTKQTVKQAVKQ